MYLLRRIFQLGPLHCGCQLPFQVLGAEQSSLDAVPPRKLHHCYMCATSLDGCLPRFEFRVFLHDSLCRDGRRTVSGDCKIFLKIYREVLSLLRFAFVARWVSYALWGSSCCSGCTRRKMDPGVTQPKTRRPYSELGYAAGLTHW